MSESRRFEPVIIVHGGAATRPIKTRQQVTEKIIECVKVGYKSLTKSGSSLNAVEEAVKYMENDPNFNAGYGSVLTMNGDIEMDAMIMEGKNLSLGSVVTVKNIQNPVSLARLIMEKTEHTMVSGAGAVDIALKHNVPTVNTETLITDKSRDRLMQLPEYKQSVSTTMAFGESTPEHDTVGAVAIDVHGNIACATSTGGITAKLPGRVGDSPLAGSGGYADNNIGGVSSTGHGEGFMKTCLAYRVLVNLQKGLSLKESLVESLDYMRARVGSAGGLIAVDRQGGACAWCTAEMMPWASHNATQLKYGFKRGETIVENLTG